MALFLGAPFIAILFYAADGEISVWFFGAVTLIGTSYLQARLSNKNTLKKIPAHTALWALAQITLNGLLIFCMILLMASALGNV
ncbi:hypothetical protein N9733_11355 [Akkermansiaceae bacterium]|nr:hypothetical protein [Akkermansiaceae bacterium]MDA7936023.1 hypothetical protein [bacterium]MDB4144043.1 hypothetical protein [Akkermansiaceae bacterium]